MNDELTSNGREHGEVLTALPRSRPHRRSTKRPAAANGSRTETAPPTPEPRPTRPAGRRKAATAASPPRLRQPPQPRGLPPKPESASAERSESSSGPDILRTAVQAAAELAEIGVTLSARMLRRTVSRLPRP